MGHCVDYTTYPATWSLDEIKRDIIEIVYNSGDGYGTENIRMPTNKIFNSYEDAKNYTYAADKGYYDGIAIKYRNISALADTNIISELRAKRLDIMSKKNKYVEEHSVKKHKASYISCQSCGSKLNKDKLKNERCPLCNTDLRSVSTLERIYAFDKQIDKYHMKIHQEQLKQKDKAPVEWLVKYEYHE